MINPLLSEAQKLQGEGACSSSRGPAAVQRVSKIWSQNARKNRLDCSGLALLVITIIERFPRHPSSEQFVGKTSDAILCSCRRTAAFGPQARPRSVRTPLLGAEIVVNLY